MKLENISCRTEVIFEIKIPKITILKIKGFTENDKFWVDLWNGFMYASWKCYLSEHNDFTKVLSKEEKIDFYKYMNKYDSNPEICQEIRDGAEWLYSVYAPDEE